MNDENAGGIVPLDERSDFAVADGSPDVRGWDVHTADGRRIGRVGNLLVDTTAMRVRYLDVEVDDRLVGTDRGRRVLVPIGYALLDRDENRILVESLDVADLTSLPAYTRAPLTAEYEDTVNSSWQRKKSSDGDGTGPTSRVDPLYENRRFYETDPTNPLV
jgi:photosynthetic reaction center H subunit